ncbi:DegT/DnrJ/EryC1/StrS family aminotransferase [Arenibaculum pallidiluteum]|uniref:DegT/DnrJ/EryC1/StrS family aminotransferase n=1 Tax=Arenibaculum pallidiluteum TaxID=2812559 RepID=UPI001A959419|nr:DegT/DnrJ/EryC1/StrS aminotransferase family protein [Arenibaculum pallidiluteum]
MLLVAKPVLGNAEKIALAEVIDSEWITQGDRVKAFERAFAERHGIGDAVAVSSCTAGLHLAMLALGIGPGDEVLVPSLTFVATANSALYAGATPVFVDIEGIDAPLMSLADAAAKCTTRTKALILVHYAGYLADLAAWRSFAERRGLLLVEDAAHAAGLVQNRHQSDAAVYSFYGNKNMTTAEGGMVAARDPGVLETIRLMRGHGMTATAQQRLTARAPAYDVTVLGYNYRMDELRAAIGLVQLERLAVWNERRARLARSYRSLLAARCPAVSVPFAEAWTSAHHILPIVLPEWADRQHVMERLRGDGIQTTVHYPPVHRLTLYRDRVPAGSLPITEAFAARELTLPLHPEMDEGQVETVVGALASALG